MSRLLALVLVALLVLWSVYVCSMCVTDYQIMMAVK